MSLGNEDGNFLLLGYRKSKIQTCQNWQRLGCVILHLGCPLTIGESSHHLLIL